MKLRLCKKCNCVKPVTEFYRNRTTGKLYKACKQCDLNRSKKWQKKRYHEDAEFRENFKAQMREYHRRKRSKRDEEPQS